MNKDELQINSCADFGLEGFIGTGAHAANKVFAIAGGGGPCLAGTFPALAGQVVQGGSLPACRQVRFSE